MAISKLAAPPTYVPDWLLHDPTKHCLNAEKEREKENNTLLSSPFTSLIYPSLSLSFFFIFSISIITPLHLHFQLFFIFQIQTNSKRFLQPNQSKETFPRQEFSLSLSPFLTHLIIYSCVWVYHAR